MAPAKKSPKRTAAPTGPTSSRQAPAPSPLRGGEQPHPHAPFPIAGIGFSAGGVEALEEFFRHLPSDMQTAYIVASHQHPTHISLLPELLRRWTSLRVIEATNGLAIEAKTVYLPPPGTRLAILHAVLHLIETEPGARPILPIDYMFRSLAADQQDNAVGIVLSGTGSDGALGLKAIKGEAGMTMAQEPRSAKYAGMPQSAIATGVVDFIRPPAELGPQIVNFLQHRLRRVPLPQLPYLPDLDTHDAQEFQKILVLLRERTGNDFSLYKDNTTRRRIARRMDVHQIETLAHYQRYLMTDPAEAQALFEELLIGVTSFFRDPSAFEALADNGLPQLLEGKPNGYPIRVWVSACSTGEEAYSLAIVLHEYLAASKRRGTVQVFASDLDAEAIHTARQGLYPQGIANDVSPARLERFFVREDSRYRVRKELRDRIIFAAHNVLKDPPFTNVDILSCRNLLIYLRPETQQWIIPLFHYTLKPDGLLMLGNSESIDNHNELFTTLDKKSRLFKRSPGPAVLPPMERLSVPAIDDLERKRQPVVPAVHRPSYLIEPIHALYLDRFAPASVLVDRRGQIVYVHGRTGLYLEPAQGLATQNVVDMARDGLRRDLVSSLQLAEKNLREVVRRGLRVQTPDRLRVVTLSVTPLREPEALKGLMLITFETESLSSAARKGRKKAVATSEDAGLVLELQYTQQRLQRSIEELQQSNEESKSANEELQSTNEELQSAKEELQSLNEELQTVNAELQSNLDELASAHDDLYNLMNSTEVATVFLDNELRIKRFTPEAARISKVIESDIGRPFADIVSTVRYEGLIDDARRVLQTLIYKEREVEGTDGRWYQLRIFPYRTAKNVIDGLVLTYLNITESKRAGQAAREAEVYAESIVDTVREPLIVLDEACHVITASRSFYTLCHLEPPDVEGRSLANIDGRKWDQPAVKSLLERLTRGETMLGDVEVVMEFPTTGLTRWMVNARRFAAAKDTAPRILLAMEDASRRSPA